MTDEAPRGPLDATLVEALLHPARALTEDELGRLVSTFPVPGAHGAAPVLPKEHRSARTLGPRATRAPVLEPIGTAAHEQLLVSFEHKGDEPLRIVVDPIGVRAGEPVPKMRRAQGTVRETVVWTRPAMDLDRFLDDLVTTTDTLAAEDRLRIRDPHGIVTPEALPRVTEIIDNDRLTLWVEDAHGLAYAVARAALSQKRPPLVRATLLGIGPRTGAASLERLVADDLHDAARTLAATTGHRIPDAHPAWGPRLREANEPELVRWSEAEPTVGYGRIKGDDRGPLQVRYSAATLHDLVARFLADWGAPTDPEHVDRLARAVAARLRPGEHPDGPTLYTIAATVFDLTTLIDRPVREETR
ncbi:MAG: hypothetical protein KY455_05815 [Euryarchaeota archaeon]|nr:hypothetical protein [Euryarchaeota archaeon]